MSSRRAGLGLILALPIAVMGVGLACSEERPPPAGYASGGFDARAPVNDGAAPINDGAGGDTGDGGDAAPLYGPELCEGLALIAPPIVDREISGPMPAPEGGKIIPGKYTLASFNVYGAPSQGTLLAVDLVITADTLRRIESRDGSAPSSSAFRYRIEGPHLALESICPTSGMSSTLPFTASPSGISLGIDATHLEAFTNN